MTAPLDTAQARELVRDVFEKALNAAEERDEFSRENYTLRQEAVALKRENARLREQLGEVREEARSLMHVVGSPEFVIGAGFMAICEGER